jgi:hypothetical protein
MVSLSNHKLRTNGLVNLMKGDTAKPRGIKKIIRRTELLSLAHSWERADR